MMLLFGFIDFTVQPKIHCLMFRMSHICLEFQHTVVSRTHMSLRTTICFQKHLNLLSSDTYINFIN